MKACTIEGCERRLKARGLCATHWWRLTHKGDVAWEPPSRSERFWAKVDKSGDCWLWPGVVDKDGYGLSGNPQFRCHRFAYEDIIGPIPTGMTIDHTCHNADKTCLGGRTCVHRRCVNPDHLEPVPRVENFYRSHNNTPNRHTHCAHGHLFDEANTYWNCRGRRVCRKCRAALVRERRRTSRGG